MAPDEAPLVALAAVVCTSEAARDAVTAPLDAAELALPAAPLLPAVAAEVAAPEAGQLAANGRVTLTVSHSCCATC